ncbi:hypothetical protein HPB48_027099 [Haemaphysalis longicornis]|uniref:Endonuclease/exonuclease/phosphatase domain-containing protein n=1 Tax=Haemaphysalis longicornis TaxID=44386 RepID=A0A9J6HCE4_HAELO|nr:hypothetical protein HPB48_027099 [Haemaphysalis longicornis]
MNPGTAVIVWQWNCRGLEGKSTVPQQYIENSEQEPDILLLQETLSKTRPLHGYRTIWSTKEDSRDLCVMTKKTHTELEIELKNVATDHAFVEVVIGKKAKKKESIHVLNIYSNPSKRKQLFRSLFRKASAEAKGAKLLFLLALGSGVNVPGGAPVSDKASSAALDLRACADSSTTEPATAFYAQSINAPISALPRCLRDDAQCPVSLLSSTPRLVLIIGNVLSATMPTFSDDYIRTGPTCCLFSGNGRDAEMQPLQDPFCFVLQVGTAPSYHGSRSNNLCLLLFLCPPVLCMIICDCMDTMRLLVICGDVEPNPGPNKQISCNLLSEEPATVVKAINEHTDSRHDELKHMLDDLKSSQVKLEKTCSRHHHETN